MPQTHLSELLRAGDLDRRIQILKLTYTKVEGEAIEGYSVLQTVWASKEETGGGEEEKSGTIVGLGTVVWTIRKNNQILVQSKKGPAMKVRESINEPVYMRDDDGEILTDLEGNPLVTLDPGYDIAYDILHVEEIGRGVGMALTTERWQ